mgnify:CR=1 FL=1
MLLLLLPPIGKIIKVLAGSIKERYESPAEESEGLPYGGKTHAPSRWSNDLADTNLQKAFVW